MGDRDIIGKDILKQFTVGFANVLFKLNIDPDRLELLDTSKQRIEERHADFLARVRCCDSGERFLLHIEIQDRNDASMPLRMLRYYTDIQLSWPGEPVRQYLIYTGRHPLRMADGVEQPTWHYRYQLFNIQQLDCQDLIDQGTPDALVMAVLCDFGGKAPQDVVNSLVLRLRQCLHDDDKNFRRYFHMLEVL